MTKAETIMEKIAISRKAGKALAIMKGTLAKNNKVTKTILIGGKKLVIKGKK